MHAKKREPQLLIITTVFPGRNSGSALALRSSLKLYMKCFRRCSYIATLEECPSYDIVEEFPQTEFVGLSFSRAMLSMRFLRSLGTKYPACVMQYLGGQKLEKIRKHVAQYRAQGGTHVIFEHLTPAVYLSLLEKDLDGLFVAFRSHDVLCKAFDSLAAAQRNGFLRRVWSWEAQRVAHFELSVVKRVHSFWTITEKDAEEYIQCFGRIPDGVIGVNIDFERFSRCNPGRRLWVVHLGGSDARKADGLSWLVDCVWPAVRGQVQGAELHLGGLGSERFGRPECGVIAHGSVADDVEFLGLGAVYINPQRAGSGLKLKSLTSLAAGRVLITTSNGCRGITGTSGKHYLVADTTAEMVNCLVTVLSHPAKFTDLANLGRSLVRSQYSEQRLVEAALHLVRRYADLAHG